MGILGFGAFNLRCGHLGFSCSSRVVRLMVRFTWNRALGHTILGGSGATYAVNTVDTKNPA